MGQGVKKLEFDVTEQDYVKLEQSAEKVGKTIPDFFVDAISLMMVLQEQKKNGFDKLLLKNETTGQIAEIVMP